MLMMVERLENKQMKKTLLTIAFIITPGASLLIFIWMARYVARF